MLFAQQVKWVKNTTNSEEKITAVFLKEKTHNLLLNNNLSSKKTQADSLYSPRKTSTYSRTHTSFLDKGIHSYLTFSQDNYTGINKVDTNGLISSSNYFRDMFATDAKIFDWKNDKILIVDNLEYETQIFPRVTVLDTFLQIDTSFFIPINTGNHIYGSAVLTTEGDLFISGSKTVSGNLLDQFLIRIDNTLQLESSRTFGSTENDWTSAKNQGLISFPGGAILTGQTRNSQDTSVTLSVVSRDNISFSHQVISSDQSVFTFNEGVTYINDTQTIYVLVECNDKSYLLVFNLDGSIKETFEIMNGEKYSKISLQDSLLYLYGNQSMACLNPQIAPSANSCLFTKTDIFSFTDVINDWEPEPYLLSPVGMNLTGSSISTTVTTGSLSLVTACPQITLTGSIKGCEKDTICVFASGAESLVWKNSANPDSILAHGNEFCFSPRENVTYFISSLYGSTYSFSPQIDDDPSCIPDTTPVVYDYLSPNGDSENDVLFIKNLSFIQPVAVRVVNAQNILLYENLDYQNDWSPALPEGTYFYSVNGTDFEKKGTLIIRR